MRGRRPDDERYRYVGYCIYCGSNEQLTDEHLVPQGLQGEHVLGEASCKACRKITTYIESRTLLGFLRPIREHHGIVSKQRRKKRPPYYVYFDNGDGTIERVEVSKEDYPLHLVMPVLPPAGILTGQRRDVGFPNPIDVCSYVDARSEAVQRRLMESDERKRKLYTTFDYGNFTKLLAKIGHGYASFYMGTGFQPLAVELIRSGRDDSSLGPYYVGGLFAQPGVLHRESRPQNLFWTQVRGEYVADVPYVIARIALFNHFQMPHYDVVVGIDKNPKRRYRLNQE